MEGYVCTEQKEKSKKNDLNPFQDMVTVSSVHNVRRSSAGGVLAPTTKVRGREGGPSIKRRAGWVSAEVGSRGTP